MTEPTSSNVPAGWYPDPAGGPHSRWWDGVQWTEHFQQPYTGVAGALKAPEGIPVYNVWIWLVTLLPLLSILSLLTIDWSSFMRVDLTDPYASQTAQFGMMSSPAYLLTQLGGWVVLGLSVLFAYFDWRQLTRLGVPRPFHWAWAFLGGVYSIGRSVVVRRRTGKGIAPMWITIGIYVLSFVVAFIIVGSVLAAAFEQIRTY